MVSQRKLCFPQKVHRGFSHLGPSVLSLQFLWLIWSFSSWKTLTNGCLRRPGYLCPVVSGITWPGRCALQDMRCLLAMQPVDTAACWLCTGNFYSSHVPQYVQHTWDGSFWEKGHELSWERSGAEMDQSDSAWLRIMLESWCKITLELGGTLKVMGIYPKDIVRFYDPKKTLHTKSSKRGSFPFTFLNYTGACYPSDGTGIM